MTDYLEDFDCMIHKTQATVEHMYNFHSPDFVKYLNKATQEMRMEIARKAMEMLVPNVDYLAYQALEE
jgi:hypothetical protein